MTTRDKVKKILEENLGFFVSGQDLAQQLNLSRTAIWKAIKGLEEQGLEIEAVKKRGYRLSQPKDLLNEREIRKKLIREIKDMKIYLYDEIDSTNNQAARLDEQEEQDNFTCLLAEGQNQGRGRLGKSFDSPKYTGIYLSLILKPQQERPVLDLLTIKVAVALVLAIEKQTGKKIQIKWVNDLYLDEKKIGGILTEGQLGSSGLNRAIVGLGLNITSQESDFSKEVQDRAGSLFPKNLPRSILVGEILNQIYLCLYHHKPKDILALYRDKNLVLGREVSFLLNDIHYTGLAKSINSEGNLIVDIGSKNLTLLGGQISLEGF